MCGKVVNQYLRTAISGQQQTSTWKQSRRLCTHHDIAHQTCVHRFNIFCFHLCTALWEQLTSCGVTTDKRVAVQIQRVYLQDFKEANFRVHIRKARVSPRMVSAARERNVSILIRIPPRSSLSRKQRIEYTTAVRCLQTKPNVVSNTKVPGARTRFDDVVSTHIFQAPFVHFSVLSLHFNVSWPGKDG